MPKVNLCRERQAQRQQDADLVDLIRKYIFTRGYRTIALAAEDCGMKRARFYRRLQEPGDFTRSELRGIAKGLRIPDDEMRPLL